MLMAKVRATDHPDPHPHAFGGSHYGHADSMGELAPNETFIGMRGPAISSGPMLLAIKRPPSHARSSGCLLLTSGLTVIRAIHRKATDQPDTPTTGSLACTTSKVEPILLTALSWACVPHSFNMAKTFS